jgi:hypothetical protein
MSGLFDQITNYSPPLLTAGQVNYKGTWSAAANSPTLVDPPAAISKGDYYVVSVAGTQFGITFAIGDWIISNGTAWEKVDLTDSVSSVFGRTGAVVGASTDYSSVGLTNTTIGASSPSTGAFTTVTASSTIAATGAVTGSNLSGTNTGDQTITLTGGVTGSGTGSFAATVVTNANLTGAVTSVGNATSLGSFTSANLASALTDETGSGAAVFATSPTLVTPILGTPASGNLANCTFPTLNQNTTGSAATLTTARAIYGNNFDGSAALTQVIASTYGGTGNGFAKFSGPASSEKTFTLPNASSTLLYEGGTIGATTANTGAFTTLSSTAADGIYSFRVAGATNKLRFSGYSTASSYIDAVNAVENAFTPLTIQGSTITVNASSVGIMASTGIGTTSPSEKLSVVSADNVLATNIFAVRANNLSQGVAITFSGIKKLTTGTDNDLYIDGASSGSIILNKIVGSGNVGINKTSPASKLYISTASTTAYGLISQTPTVGLTTGDYVNMAYFADSRGDNNDGLRIISVRDSTGSSSGNWDTSSMRIRRSVDYNDVSSGVQAEVVFGNNILALVAGGAERGRFSGAGLAVTGALTSTGALAIGNTVTAAVAVASTHKVTIVIGGVTYYLLASNV